MVLAYLVELDVVDAQDKSPKRAFSARPRIRRSHFVPIPDIHLAAHDNHGVVGFHIRRDRLSPIKLDDYPIDPGFAWALGFLAKIFSAYGPTPLHGDGP
jgi:hypothetical protein